MIETIIFYILVGGGSGACVIALKNWMDTTTNYNDSKDE